MNSIILMYLSAFGSKTAKWFCESCIGRLFLSICAAVEKSWANSAVIGLFRAERGDFISGSKFGKLFKAVAEVFAQIKSRIGTALNKGIKDSFICRMFRIYLHNFIAINTRFYGIMLLSFSIAYTLAKLILGNGLLLSGIIGMLMGGVLLLSNCNFIDFIDNSAVVEFCKSSAGFKGLNLAVYCKDSTKGRTRLLLACAAGLLSGVLSAAGGIILGALVPFGTAGIAAVLYAPVCGVFFAVFAAPFVPTIALAGLILLSAMSLLIKSLVKEDFKWKFDAVGIGILLLLGILLISSLLSFSRASSVKVWLMYAVFLGFYVIIVNAVDNKEQLYALLKVFVISAALVALYGIMQYLFGWTTSNSWIDEEMFENATMRVYSTLGNPNVLGEYLLLALPLAAVWFLKQKASTISKWVYAAIFLVLALCLVLTQSRGCWIGFILSAVVFITFYEGKWWGLIPIALCIIPFVIPETMVDRFLSIGDMNDSSTSYRVFIWLGTLGMLKHYWLGGIGMGEGAFNQVYPFFSYNAIQAPHSHNLYLQLTVEAGIGALIVFLFTMFIFLKKMSDVYRLENKKSLQSSAALAIAAGVIGFLAQSMFDYTFYNYRVMAVFFMVMAMGTAFLKINERGGNGI